MLPLGLWMNSHHKVPVSFMQLQVKKGRKKYVHHTYSACNPLPYGNPEFSDIREQNMIYVDKTELIAEIASQRVPIFLSRPRRFGKSLLINTLHYLFSNGLEYFHGLEIEKIWKDKTYKVVHFDFSRMAAKNAQDFKFALSTKIIEEFCECDDLVQSNSPLLQHPDIILDKISKKLTNNSVVFLIDEYDAPLTHHINEPDELKKITNILSDFYATIKQYSGRFRFVFITGVTRVSHISIFSAFNNLKDLSLREEFSSLLGFTQDNLEQYFDSYVENASQILNISKIDVYKSLERYYDGYQFSLAAKETVYNPWSILSFFDSPQVGYTNYWFESGGTPSIIMQYLKINDSFDFIDYNNHDIYIEFNKIARKYEITNIPINILLYQTGYLTIRNENDGTAHLVFPNTEVEESLLLLYLEENNLIPSRKLKQKMKTISDNIDSKNLIEIINTFNSILNECVSSSSNIFNDERSVRDIIYAALIQIPSLQKIKERETVKGKSDLELVTDKTCMIIEFKRTYPQRDPKASLHEAIAQIKKNRYGELFSQTHTLYRVGMVIETNEKKILHNFCQEVC